jgi:proprotein convertase subtilisin/kexin type 5
VRCQTCVTTSTYCQQCNPLHGTILNGSSCICNSNQYQNSISLVCINCSPYCLTCTSNSNSSCLSCYNYMLRTYSSVAHTCDCTPGYYDNGILNCSACASPCATCNGGSVYNCTSCISGYSLIGSSCMPTLVCSNYFWNGVCVNTCPNTTYYGLNVCSYCINDCLTCTTASSCTSCQINFYLLNNVCYASCPLGTYSISANRSCNTCPT